MPYIHASDRAWLDMGAKPRTPGELNYLFMEILLTYLPPHPSYADYNAVVGVLECVKQEFYRRAAAPYEDMKARDNGDLEWPRCE